MQRADIEAVYASGWEAVVELVTGLVARVAERQEQMTAQEQQIVALTARVKELADRLASDSHNSSQPPSSDGFTQKKARSLRQASGKKPGGQPGHPGSTLRFSETPDEVVTHRPAACRAGGEALAGEPATSAERRQVVDLPPLALAVVEHRAERKACPRCGVTTAAGFPEALTQPVQYGPRLQALGVYLIEYQLLPYHRASELLADVFGGAPSEGTLVSAVERCAAGLVETEAAIKEALRQAAVGHFDESGLRDRGEAALLAARRQHAHPDPLRGPPEARQGSLRCSGHPARLHRASGP